MLLYPPLARGPHRSFAPPRARRWGWGVVLGLHAAAGWWAWSLKGQAPSHSPAPVVVWWQPLPPDPALPAPLSTPAPSDRPGAPAPTPQPTPAPAPPKTQPRPAESPADTRQGTGLPSGAELAPTAEAAGSPAAATATPASAASSPLKLTLPPRHATQQPSAVGAALNDARSNSPVKTLESRLAGVMGDGRWTMEDLGEGRKRYRRGAQCIETRPARSNQIDPFNAGFRNAPDLVGGC